MSLTRVTAPSVQPLTEAEVWAHLRVSTSGSPAVPADRALILNLMAAATDLLDGKDGLLGRCIMQQTWDLKLDGFPCGGTSYFNSWGSDGAITIPLPPLRSVTSITYVDENAATQTLSSSLYTVDASSEPGRIVPAYGQVWPVTLDFIDTVTIRFVAGYADDGASPPDYRANVPGDLKAAMLLIIGHWYGNRETAGVAGLTEIPMGAQMLLAKLRRWST